MIVLRNVKRYHHPDEGETLAFPKVDEQSSRTRDSRNLIEQLLSALVTCKCKFYN